MDQAAGSRMARNSVFTNKIFEPKWKQMLISAAKEIVRVWNQLAKQKFYISDEDKLISSMIMPPTNRSYSVTLYRHAKNFSIAAQGMSMGCVQASKFFSEGLFTIADYVGSWNQKTWYIVLTILFFLLVSSWFYLCNFYSRTKIEVEFSELDRRPLKDLYRKRGLKLFFKCVFLEWITPVSAVFLSFNLTPSKIY